MPEYRVFLDSLYLVVKRSLWVLEVYRRVADELAELEGRRDGCYRPAGCVGISGPSVRGIVGFISRTMPIRGYGSSLGRIFAPRIWPSCRRRWIGC